MMGKYTITNSRGVPKRIVYVPADEIAAQLLKGEKFRAFREEDQPQIAVEDDL